MYVGTPHNLGSPLMTLASIIQGEAGNQQIIGMQAVAAVMANRAAQNFNGFGADVYSQAMAPNQFQGQVLSPSQISPEAMQVAQGLLAGQNPDPTGGALYYANPGASTFGNWGSRLNSSNALQIGSHFFTDNTQGIAFQPGAPTLDQANASSSTSPGIAGSMSYATPADAAAAGDAGSGAALSWPAGWGSTPTDASATGAQAPGTMTTQSGTGPDFSAFGVTASPAGSSAPLTQSAVQSVTSGDVAPAAPTDSTNATANAITVPLAIDQQTMAQSSAVQSLANTLAKAMQGAAQTSAANTQATNTTDIGVAGKAMNWGSNIFVRFGFVILGVLLVIAGVFFLAPKAAKETFAASAA